MRLEKPRTKNVASVLSAKTKTIYGTRWLAWRIEVLTANRDLHMGCIFTANPGSAINFGSQSRVWLFRRTNKNCRGMPAEAGPIRYKHRQSEPAMNPTTRSINSNTDLISARRRSRPQLRSSKKLPSSG
jgi:hypothetical protein